MLSVSETAAALGFSECTVRRQLAAGHIPGVKLGGGSRSHWRVSAEWVRSLTSAGVTGPAAAQFIARAAVLSTDVDPADRVAALLVIDDELGDE